MLLVPGLVFTVEYDCEGGPECKVLEDDWTVVTRMDHCLLGEHIVVTESGVEILV